MFLEPLNLQYVRLQLRFDRTLSSNRCRSLDRPHAGSTLERLRFERDAASTPPPLLPWPPHQANAFMHSNESKFQWDEPKLGNESPYFTQPVIKGLQLNDEQG